MDVGDDSSHSGIDQKFEDLTVWWKKKTCWEEVDRSLEESAMVRYTDKHQQSPPLSPLPSLLSHFLSSLSSPLLSSSSLSSSSLSPFSYQILGINQQYHFWTVDGNHEPDIGQM